MLEDIKKIRSDFITDPAVPMRVELDKEKLWELAESIKMQGLINPITVRPVGDKFEVVAGHRRFKACQIVGIVEISCVVRELTDNQVFDIMAAENLERQDVDPVEEALFLYRLSNSGKVSVVDLARRMNRSIPWVESRLSIIDYPEYMQIALSAGTLKLGVAENLAGIIDDVYRRQYVDSAIKNGMSVLQSRYLKTQFDMGILIPSESFMPKDDELGMHEPALVRAPCARCGGIAVEPNLKNVFIHVDCPIDSVSAD